MPPDVTDTDEYVDLSWKPLIKVVYTNTEHRGRAKLNIWTEFHRNVFFGFPTLFFLANCDFLVIFFLIMKLNTSTFP